MLPLDDIKVLDLSRLAPGPFCTMLLGDLGADVLLIEAPSDTKAGGPGSAVPAVHNALARNKRSIVLNLRDEAAREVFYKLVESADVVVEGFRPGVVKRLGVDYETLAAKNERIVYCSVSGYGQDGPYAGLVGHDINYISIGGALGMIGNTPEGPPAIPMNIIADFAGGGLHAAYGILAALHARERTGSGQYVDIAMSDGTMYLLAMAISGYFATGRAPEAGNTILNGGASFYNVYQCKDGWFSIGSIEPHFWANLCKVMEREDLVPHQYNMEKRDEAAAHFRDRFKTKTRDEWFEIMKQSDICAAPIYSLDEALQDPHNLHRKMVIEVDGPDGGPVKQVGIGTKLSETPGSVRSVAPTPGQHTDDVLSTLGYDAGAIASLREKGVVG
jgi:crotonobetainyl-CoA:carnitine CoA-transferase CaiB-like acyl-CoA transferase